MSIPLKLTARQNEEPPTLAGGTSCTCLPAILQYPNNFSIKEPKYCDY